MELQAIYIERGLTKDLARQVRLWQPPQGPLRKRWLPDGLGSSCVSTRSMSSDAQAAGPWPDRTLAAIRSIAAVTTMRYLVQSGYNAGIQPD